MKNLFLILSLILVVCCKSDETKKPTGENETDNVQSEVSQAVCVSRTAIRAEPSNKSKYLATINVGESIQYLGKSVIDSTNPKKPLKFLKLQLSDETVGWSYYWGIITNAYPAVISSKTNIYNRPDLMTISNKEFSPMDFIAVEESKDDWIKVVGKGRKLKGWIKEDNISKRKEDIGFAVLAQKTLDSKEGSLLEKINDILSENPYPSSIFVQTLKDIQEEELSKQELDSEVEEIIEEGY